jgi:hypothetical protein
MRTHRVSSVTVCGLSIWQHCWQHSTAQPSIRDHNGAVVRSVDAACPRRCNRTTVARVQVVLAAGAVAPKKLRSRGTGRKGNPSRDRTR